MSHAPEVRVGLVTVPAEAGAELARQLVEERVAACVNLIPGVRSIYRWEGAIEEEDEVLLVLKLSARGAPRAVDRIAELHPYATPEVVLLEVTAGFPAYLEWVIESTRDTP